MEILVTSNENPTLVPVSFDKSIKFVAYRRNQIIIVTNTDEIYQFNIGYSIFDCFTGDIHVLDYNSDGKLIKDNI
ncbi:hypothetical protein ABK040_014499 [Willaertia magna]